jgi:peptidoglycan/LPS O-acetylase OafA/YrhL
MESNTLVLDYKETSHIQEKPNLERSRAQRNTTIELARLLAALGVIAAHVPSDANGASWFVTALSPLRVPFFYSLSLFMFVASLPRTTPERVASRIWYRTLIPYLSWTFLYETLIIGKALLTHGHHELVWWRTLFYGESAVQLYFLPTLLMLQVLALGLYLLLTPGTNQHFTGCLLLTGGIIYYAWGAYFHCFGIGGPNSILAYSIYLLAAFWLSPIIASQRIRPTYAIIGGGIVILAICGNSLGYRMLLYGYPMVVPLGGVGALLLTTGLPSQWKNGWLLKATSFTFGIYLCHPLFIELFDFLMHHVYPITVSYNSSIKMLEVAVVFAASGILVVVLRRVEIVRRLLLGER